MTKICGKSVVKEAFNAGRKIYNIMVTDVFLEKEAKLVEVFKSNKIPVNVVKKHILEPYGNHQGILAEVEDYKYKELNEVLNGNKQYFIILDGIVDPHNLGAILRSADACSIDGIIIPKNRSVSLNATVAKVSTGAIEHVNVIQVNNITRAIQDLKKNGFWVVGTDMVADKLYTEIDPSTSLAIVIGNEGEGMSRLVKENCDYLVNIPMDGHVNSLNASVSAALLMYEIKRKR